MKTHNDEVVHICKHKMKTVFIDFSWKLSGFRKGNSFGKQQIFIFPFQIENSKFSFFRSASRCKIGNQMKSLLIFETFIGLEFKFSGLLATNAPLLELDGSNFCSFHVTRWCWNNFFLFLFWCLKMLQSAQKASAFFSLFAVCYHACFNFLCRCLLN